MLPLILLLLRTPEVTAGLECSSVVSFNTGLTRTIPNYEDRKSRLGQALVSQNASLVCLQEMWEGNDVEDLLAEVGHIYPYSFSLLHNSVGDVECTPCQANRKHCITGPACSQQDLIGFSQVIECATAEGCLPELLSSPPDGLACVSKKCAHLLRTVTSAECVSCIVVTFTGLPQAGSLCSAGSTRDNRFNGPGLVLLSRDPLTRARYQDYFPGTKSVFRRGFLTVSHKNLGGVTCTHLSSTTGSYFEYDDNLKFYGNYSELQREEGRRLIQALGSRRKQVLLGDFNSGPRVHSQDPEKNLDPEAEKVYQSLLKNKFSSPYLAQDGRCTYCNTTNPLVNFPNEIIDHILTRGCKFNSFVSQRILDTKPVLSDHYGVRADLCLQ